MNEVLRGYVPRGQLKEFARRLGISYSYAKRLVNGHGRPSVALALKIERVTVGRIRAQDLRPEAFGIAEQEKSPQAA